MRRFYLLVLFIPGLTGCTPESVVWSPDGQAIAVATPKGIYLADVNRNAGPLIDVRPWAETPIVWLPDSKGLLVIHQRPVENWSELETILGPDQVAQAKDHAQKIVTHSEAFVGNWNNLDVPGTVSRPVLAGAWAWLRETKPPVLKRYMMGDEFGNSSEWEKVKSFQPKVFRVSLYSVSGLKASFERTIFETVETIWSARLSPDGRHLASVVTQSASMKNDSFGIIESNEGADLSLWVASMDDLRRRVRIAENVGFWTAWAPTGNSLAFLSVDRWVTEESRAFATLCQWEVEPRLLASDGEVTPTLQKLLHLTASPFTKITFLPDGRILVPAEERSLPSLMNQDLADAYLYTVHPQAPAQLTKIMPKERNEEINEAILQGSFQISPKGDQLAFTTKQTATALMAIDTGEITWIEPPVQKKSGTASIQTSAPVAPCWNKEGEFVYLAPAKSAVTKSDRAELVLWGPNKLVNLSQNWEWFAPFR